MTDRHISQLPLARPYLGTWPTTQACVLTGNQTSDPYSSQASTQSAEPHQPGQEAVDFKSGSVLLSGSGASALLTRHLVLLPCRAAGSPAPTIF